MTHFDRAAQPLSSLFPALSVVSEEDVRCDATLRAGAALQMSMGLIGRGFGYEASEPLPTVTLRSGAPGSDTTDRELSVTKLIGAGGMGRVYLAHQASLDRAVAIKVVHPDAAGVGGIEALVEEGRTLGHVEHPNVVPVHAIGQDENGLPVLVMKRVDGVPWRELIADAEHAGWSIVRTISSTRMAAHLEILIQVCNAIQFAHSRGVVHRDVKPENVILGPCGEVYLLDWGIAARMENLARASVAALVGTPAYMAPEMLAGDSRRVDARTDVYLLGACLHEILTGRPRHPCDSLREALESVAASAPYVYPPSVSADLAAICNRATHADPAARFASADELREALGAHLRHAGSVLLSDAATARIAELRAISTRIAEGGGGTADEVYRVAAEARFGFRQALREWPGNEAAAGGLRTAIETVADFDIGRRNADAARAWMTELDGPSTAVLERLAALDRTLRERRERSVALEQKAHDTDLSVASGSYAIWFGVFGATIAVMAALAAWLRLASRAPMHLHVQLAGLVFVAVAVAALAGRKRLATTASRQVAGFVVVMVGAVFFNRVLLALRGIGMPDAIDMDLLIVAAFNAVGGIFLRRWFFSFAVFFFVSAAIGAVVPIAAPFLFVAGTLLVMGVGGVLWRRGVP